MNDFEYDVYRKKNIANSARKRKGGSKSRRCPLSTDNMSHKEWKERCGSVMSYNMGKPMDWLEFNKLPKDLKEEYINSLIQKYSVNSRNLAKMFGVSPVTVARLVKKEELDVEFVRGRTPVGDKLEAFNKFLEGNSGVTEQDQAEMVETSESEVCAVEDDAPQEVNDFNEAKDDPVIEQKTYLDSFTLNFSGALDVDMIMNSLRYILGSDVRGEVKIQCDLHHN